MYSFRKLPYRDGLAAGRSIAAADRLVTDLHVIHLELPVALAGDVERGEVTGVLAAVDAAKGQHRAVRLGAVAVEEKCKLRGGDLGWMNGGGGGGRRRRERERRTCHRQP